MVPATDSPGELISVAGKTFVSHERGAFLLGLAPQSFSSSLSRGRIQLTRYPRGRGFMYALDEIEQLILKRAVKPGQRVR
jgi:hypothetical protein